MCQGQRDGEGRRRFCCKDEISFSFVWEVCLLFSILSFFDFVFIHPCHHSPSSTRIRNFASRTSNLLFSASPFIFLLPCSLLLPFLPLLPPLKLLSLPTPSTYLLPYLRNARTNRSKSSLNIPSVLPPVNIPLLCGWFWIQTRLGCCLCRLLVLRRVLMLGLMHKR